jgi:hypothetical protein
MPSGNHGTSRTRVIIQIALRTGWTPEQVRDMSIRDLEMIVQELTGRRTMTEAEIFAELAKCRPNL